MSNVARSARVRVVVLLTAQHDLWLKCIKDYLGCGRWTNQFPCVITLSKNSNLKKSLTADVTAHSLLFTCFAILGCFWCISFFLKFTYWVRHRDSIFYYFI